MGLAHHCFLRACLPTQLDDMGLRRRDHEAHALRPTGFVGRCSRIRVSAVHMDTIFSRYDTTNLRAGSHVCILLSGLAFGSRAAELGPRFQDTTDERDAASNTAAERHLCPDIRGTIVALQLRLWLARQRATGSSGCLS